MPLHSLHPSTPAVLSRIAISEAPPDTVFEEVKVMSSAINSAHSAEAVNLACLVHLTRTAFRAYSVSTGVDLEPALALQRKYLRAYMSMKNIQATAVLSALASLERAEVTVGYLDSLPS